MATKQKRDNDYYFGQLAARFPQIHANYLAGKYRSARAAFIDAGLKVERTQLQILVRSWEKATDDERKRFLALVHPAVPLVGASVGGSIFAADWTLEPWAMAEIRRILLDKRMKIGDLMRALGFKALDTSVGMAVNGGARIRNPALASALEIWVLANTTPSNAP